MGSVVSVEAVHRRFAQAMAALAPFETSPHLAIALSGGGDSVALLHLACQWAEMQGASLTALTVDHGLRDNAREEAEMAGNGARALGIVHEILTWSGEKPKAGLQAAARSARYRLLDQWCAMHGILHLLVAHTLNDQAETHLMRQSHGSGPEGLAAMSSQRELVHCRLLRPLLGETRDTLRTYLRQTNRCWIDDPSNENEAFERIRWRRRIKQEKRLVSGFVETIADYGHQRQRDDWQLSSQISRLVNLQPFGNAVVRLDDLVGLEPALARRLVGRVLSVVGGGAYRPERRKIEGLFNDFAKSGPVAATLAGCRIKENKGILHIFREARHLPAPQVVRSGDELLWDGRFKMQFGRGLETARGTAWLRPFVDTDWPVVKAVSEGAGTVLPPLELCRNLPVIADDDGLLAVAHLNYRRAEMEMSSNNAGDIVQFLSFCPLNGLSGSGFSVAKSGKLTIS